MGVSQTELAQRAGLSQSGLSKRPRGVIAFDVNELAHRCGPDVDLSR